MSQKANKKSIHADVDVEAETETKDKAEEAKAAAREKLLVAPRYEEKKKSPMAMSAWSTLASGKQVL